MGSPAHSEASSCAEQSAAWLLPIVACRHVGAARSARGWRSVLLDMSEPHLDRPGRTRKRHIDRGKLCLREFLADCPRHVVSDRAHLRRPEILFGLRRDAHPRRARPRAHRGRAIVLLRRLSIPPRHRHGRNRERRRRRCAVEVVGFVGHAAARRRSREDDSQRLPNAAGRAGGDRARGRRRAVRAALGASVGPWPCSSPERLVTKD
mmetsp:Transcript_35364/g.109112  ORF Transcript_35364/g.109112 Transcript_35364/m.109112 type:complete len:207 (+) Transcript_35364:189-809(+)